MTPLSILAGHRGVRVLPALLLLAAFLGAWELYVDLGGVDPLVLPPPHAVASALYHDRGLLWSNLKTTAGEILVGMALAVSIALVLSVAIHFSNTVRRAVLPLLIASQTLPIVIIAPLLILWLGFAFVPRLLVIALVAFFPLVVTTLDALDAVDPDLIKLMRTFDASRLRTFRQIELPAVLPGLFTGAKLAAVFSVIGAVFAEQAGATHGLGYLLTIAINQFLVPEAWAAVTVLSVFAIALFALITLLERRTVPWAHHTKGEAA
ncbi:MAG TPA: ABC transporter permease [Solirubrobacteraceae bacterium]|nr:ABC transporter permease [Solirubrobacteraceae bacterium]